MQFHESEFTSLQGKPVTPLVRREVNYEELQNFIKGCFEENYGVATVVDVEAVKYNPDITYIPSM